MKIEHHISFWDKKSYEKAIKYLKNKKQYKKKQIDGFIMLPFHSLVKIYEDFQTYAMCTKAGLIQQNREDFNGWEEFDKVLKKVDSSNPKGIWGKFIVQVK